jgi:hypothetical protein
MIWLVCSGFSEERIKRVEDALAKYATYARLKNASAKIMDEKGLKDNWLKGGIFI